MKNKSNYQLRQRIKTLEDQIRLVKFLADNQKNFFTVELCMLFNMVDHEQILIVSPKVKAELEMEEKTVKFE
jgi:hypothetical protein